jgi:hypothetical protein
MINWAWMGLSCRAAPPAGLLAVLVGGVGCTPEPPQLVALHGCGLDRQAEFSDLRVVVRGDFPPDDHTELLLGPGDHGEFAELPDQARALTVEGLVGDFPAAVGRTRGVAEGQLVAYFAPANSLCSVPSGVVHREHAGMDVGSTGELLLVGGRTETGQVLDEIVRVDLDGQESEILASTLPAPTAGQSLHAIADRRFLMIGGARPSGRWFSTLEIDLDRGGDAVAAPVNLEVGGQPHGVAYAGTARGPDDRVLVAGGCATIDAAARCATGSGQEAAEVSRLAFWIDPESKKVQRVPDLERARYEPVVLVGRDGVAYALGGRDGEDAPVPTLERLPVGAAAWEVLADDLPPVAGGGLLEDGLVVVTHVDGSVSWYGDESSGLVELGQTLEMANRRPVATSPGERLITDTWMLPVGSAEGEDARALDLVEETPAGVGPGPRIGPELVELDDGSVLLVGGRSPGGTVAAPFLARVRPPLDGPDERVPDVASPDPEAFVATPPGAAVVDAKALVLEAGGQIEDYPSARAHVRGFRSHSFGFDFEVQAEARAHVLVLQGALEGLSLRLDPDGVVARRRHADGSVGAADCELGPAPMIDGSASLRLDVSPAAVTLEQAGEPIVTCEALSGAEAAVGFGVSGQGTVEIRQMRLRRR